MSDVDARVILWGRDIGAVSWVSEKNLAVFQYRPEFVQSGIQVAPLCMPLREAPYSFPALSKETFRGLPGMLADSLPDKFGNRMIDAWLAGQGRSTNSFSPVERLCYVGKRGMGALEFEPRQGGDVAVTLDIEIEQLVALSNRVLNERAQLGGQLQGEKDSEAINEILRVGTSAGGARAKAVLAWNPDTNEFRSGQIDSTSGFQHWLVKFDGVDGNSDKELADPQGFGIIEYTYYLMAKRAGIDMMECRLHYEGGRSHFMTRRFDRVEQAQDKNHETSESIVTKLHMQSLGAIAHFDYNEAGAYSYEQAIQVIRQLGLPSQAKEQLFLRAVFNVIARNQDDHVKNIAFLMDKNGEWSLAPAFDVVYAWQPDGAWTGQHQMSISSKRDNFTREDLLSLATLADIKTRKANTFIDDAVAAVRDWSALASEQGVDSQMTTAIANAHRINI